MEIGTCSVCVCVRACVCVHKCACVSVFLPSLRFDSNCITPGTEFMHRLHRQLKYFVNKKIATDPSWQGVEVVLSGQEVREEGVGGCV